MGCFFQLATDLEKTQRGQLGFGTKRRRFAHHSLCTPGNNLDHPMLKFYYLKYENGHST